MEPPWAVMIYHPGWFSPDLEARAKMASGDSIAAAERLKGPNRGPEAACGEENAADSERKCSAGRRK